MEAGVKMQDVSHNKMLQKTFAILFVKDLLYYKRM